MKMNYVSADSRGSIDHGWLKTFHTYSFGNYYDPNRMGFGTLRVLNDDIIEAGKGFGKHPHRNMEIITIPTEGKLGHGDNMGNQTVILKGEVQAMSAGTGVIHSEMNASETDAAKIFQIWIETRDENIKPQYSQKKFEAADRQNKWQLVIAPNTAEENVVKIHQDAWLSLGNFEAEQKVNYKLKDATKNGVFLFVIEGEIKIENQTLSRRDALEIENTEKIDIMIQKDSQLLLMEIPL